MFRKEKYDGLIQERGNRVANEMKQLLDGRSDPLKRTKSDILQLTVINGVLTDNKELDSDFKKINCTSEIDIFLKNACFDNITDNQKLRSQKNRTYAEAVSGTKNTCGKPVKDVQKIGKSTLGMTDHKVVRNESIYVESIYVRLAKASSLAEDLPSPPKVCTDTSIVQNSSSSANSV